VGHVGFRCCCAFYGESLLENLSPKPCLPTLASCHALSEHSERSNADSAILDSGSRYSQ
jgi:hypothetical protein